MQVVSWKKEPCTLKRYHLPGTIGLTGCSLFASPTTELYDDSWPLRLSVPCNCMDSSELWCFSRQISQDGTCESAWMASHVSFMLFVKLAMSRWTNESEQTVEKDGRTVRIKLHLVIAFFGYLGLTKPTEEFYPPTYKRKGGKAWRVPIGWD